MNTKNTYHFGAIGVVEVSFYVNAVIILDEMLKTSEVQVVSCEKKLGGRLVSIIVAGDTSSVNAAIETAQGLGKTVGEKNIKVAVAISNPHTEIIKLLNLIKKPVIPKTSESSSVKTETIISSQNEQIKEKLNHESQTAQNEQSEIKIKSKTISGRKKQ